LPRDRTGDLVNSGERTPGELVEYAGLITDTFAANPYTWDELIAMHRQRNATRTAPRPALRPFNTHRSLRRGMIFMLDRVSTADRFDAREINRKAVKHWPTIRHMIVDMHGRPLGEVRALNPANPPLDPGRARPHGLPQLREMRGPSPFETGGSGPGDWCDLGTGASGPDVISLIVHLSGGCDRRVAADYLAGLVDRLIEVAA